MQASGERVTAWVRESLASHQSELPAFPAVAGRLVSVLEHPDADVAEIESLIHQDQAIAAEVVRIANSTLYRGVVRIESLSRAILRLGFRETANIAVASACRSLYDIQERAEFEAFPRLWKSLWLDSLACAFGARYLSRELGVGDDERVFLGAMFRDIGSLLVLKTLARGLVRGRLRELPAPADLEHAVTSLHADVGAAYLRGSGMPDHVASVAQRHHAPAVALEPGTLEIHLIRLAGGVCEQIGIAPFSNGALDPAATQSREALEVEPERLEYFASQFECLVEQLRALL